MSDENLTEWTEADEKLLQTLETPPVEEEKEEVEEEKIEEKEEKEEEEPKKEVKTVPLSALHEARDKLKAERARIRELEERIKALEGLKATETAEEVPDPDTQPFDFVMHRINKIAEAVEGLKKTETTKEREGKIVQEFETVRNAYVKDAMTLKAAGEDPEGVSAFFSEQRKSFYEAQYPEATAAQLAVLAQRDEYDIVTNALKLGLSPAKLMRNAAEQLGYAPKTAPKKDLSKNDLERMKSAAKTAAPSGSTGGGAEMTVEWLAGLSDTEFKKLMDDPETNKKIDKLMKSM